MGVWQWGYELQWACGSGVTSYSGPVAVGLRVTVGLWQWGCKLPRQSYWCYELQQASDRGYSGPVAVVFRVTVACGSGITACGTSTVGRWQWGNESHRVGLWQWGYELQWACGSGVTSYSGPVAVGLRVTVGLWQWGCKVVSYCGSGTGVTSYSRPVTGVTVGLWQWCSELQWACGSWVTS